MQTDGNEIWLIDSHIAPYDPASRENHDPKRKRKLLLKKKEINEIWQAIKQKGLTTIPTELYLKDGLAKLDVATAKGKKLYDKRHDIAKRDMQRDSDREFRQR